MYLIDSHAHIYLEAFDQDRSEMLNRAVEAGVRRIFMPHIDSLSTERMLLVEDENPDLCYAMMGLHPCSVQQDFEKELLFVENWLSKRKFAAMGEIGIDLYWDKTYEEQQKEAFIQQISMAQKYGLSIVIHSRESLDLTISTVASCVNESLKGVFHCFTGNLSQASQIIEMGFYLGIGGVATFKNGGLEEVLLQTPLEHLIIETDSPYLAPVPYRGKRNEPAYLRQVVQKIAHVKHVSEEDVARQTSRNVDLLYGR
ncbi:MAG: TatD family hydrolase [Cyclobacteriaceae bacterium]|nr:TatD family hydrolase [Cyclobacteriaceae bacterium]